MLLLFCSFALFFIFLNFGSKNEGWVCLLSIWFRNFLLSFFLSFYKIFFQSFSIWKIIFFFVFCVSSVRSSYWFLFVWNYFNFSLNWMSITKWMVMHLVFFIMNLWISIAITIVNFDTFTYSIVWSDDTAMISNFK